MRPARGFPILMPRILGRPGPKSNPIYRKWREPKREEATQKLLKVSSRDFSGPGGDRNYADGGRAAPAISSIQRRDRGPIGREPAPGPFHAPPRDLTARILNKATVCESCKACPKAPPHRGEFFELAAFCCTT
jgi:hypothetical protein